MRSVHLNMSFSKIIPNATAGGFTVLPQASRLGQPARSGIAGFTSRLQGFANRLQAEESGLTASILNSLPDSYGRIVEIQTGAAMRFTKRNEHLTISTPNLVDLLNALNTTEGQHAKRSVTTIVETVLHLIAQGETPVITIPSSGLSRFLPLTPRLAVGVGPGLSREFERPAREVEEIVRELQQRCEELKKIVKALETPKTADLEITKLKQTIKWFNREIQQRNKTIQDLRGIEPKKNLLAERADSPFVITA